MNRTLDRLRTAPDGDAISTLRSEPLRVDLEASLNRVQVSSDVPVMRDFGHGFYSEVLDHNRSAINLRDASSRGVPILLEHRAGGDIFGRAYEPRLTSRDDGSRVLSFAFDLGGTEASDNLLRSIERGFTRDVSLGWTSQRLRLRDLEQPASRRRSGDGETYDADEPLFEARFERWTPAEISFVASPADRTVGLSRSRTMYSIPFSVIRNGVTMTDAQNGNCLVYNAIVNQPGDDDMLANLLNNRSQEQAPADSPATEVAETPAPVETIANTRAEPVATEPAAAPVTPETVTATRAEPVDDDSSRQLAFIRQFEGETGNLQSTGLSDGSIATIRADVIAGRLTDMAAVRQRALALLSSENVVSAPAQVRPENLGDRRQVYNLAKHVREAAFGRPTGFEEEMAREMAIAYPGVDVPGNGLNLTIEMMRRDPNIVRLIRGHGNPFTRTVSSYEGTGSDDTSSALNVTDLDDSMVISHLYQDSVVLPHLSYFASQLQRDINIPIETGEPDVTWVGEQPTLTDNTGIAMTTTRTWAYKNMTMRQRYTEQLMHQAPLFVDHLFAAIRRHFPIGLEKAVINGTGSGNQPRGILNFTSLPTVAIAANGGVPTFSHLNQLKTKLSVANAFGLGKFKYLMDSTTAGYLTETQKFTGTTGETLMRWDNRAGGMANGSQVLVTDNLPHNLTKGTNTDCRAIIGGCFNEIKVGFFSNLLFTVDPYSEGDNLRHIVRVRQAVDFNYLHLEAFAAILDVRV